LVDEGVGVPRSPTVYNWGMSPQVREVVGMRPYQPAAQTPAGLLGYDPRALLEATRVPNEPPIQRAAAANLAGGARAEEEYWQQKYQYALLEQQAERAERQRQFNLQQEGRNYA